MIDELPLAMTPFKSLVYRANRTCESEPPLLAPEWLDDRFEIKSDGGGGSRPPSCFRSSPKPDAN
jgi:hypothetical protein